MWISGGLIPVCVRYKSNGLKQLVSQLRRIKAVGHRVDFNILSGKRL
jgi:hypothetical protein